MKPGVTGADRDVEGPHHGLALTADGRTLSLAGRASDYAALVEARDLSLIATIPVGDGPGWAEVTDDGRFCLVTNTRAADLSIIDIASRSEVARVPMDKGPKHITMARLPAPVIHAVKARRQKVAIGLRASRWRAAQRTSGPCRRRTPHSALTMTCLSSKV